MKMFQRLPVRFVQGFFEALFPLTKFMEKTTKKIDGSKVKQNSFVSCRRLSLVREREMHNGLLS